MKKILLTAGLLAMSSLGLMAGENPEFPGGEAALNKYITDNLKYPASAQEAGIEGMVTVQFLVHTDGSLGTIKIVRMVDPDLEQEAIRLVKGMPAWIPAEKDGAPVEAPAQVNVPFVIE